MIAFPGPRALLVNCFQGKVIYQQKMNKNLLDFEILTSKENKIIQTCIY